MKQQHPEKISYSLSLDNGDLVFTFKTGVNGDNVSYPKSFEVSLSSYQAESLVRTSEFDDFVQMKRFFEQLRDFAIEGIALSDKKQADNGDV